MIYCIMKETEVKYMYKHIVVALVSIAWLSVYVSQDKLQRQSVGSRD